MTTIEQTVTEIREAWSLLFGDTPVPTDNEIATWVLRYGRGIAKEAVSAAGIKFRKLDGQMSGEYIGRFISSVMRQIEQAATKEE
jgi:hypothetical protein